jgi:DNA mismatch endonuclease (patch repair protein)
MSLVPRRNSRPELAVRRMLHSLGFRFRLHRADLPGTPDVVLPRYRVALYVHGCFWHQHPGCRRARRPGSNVQYLESKLDANLARDRRVMEAIQALGWSGKVIWECETTTSEQLKIHLLSLLE